MANRSPDNPAPKAPRYEALPVRNPRAARGGAAQREFCVRLEVVTPILGGSYRTRQTDDVDIIRAASIRGHLRLWWRALYAMQFARAEQLYESECALWGRAARDNGGRSAVEIRVGVEDSGNIDDGDIDPQRTPGAYALWPARSEKRQGRPPAPRRKPGTKFQLTLKTTSAREAEVKNAISAWALFGGYGGRTRRGLGSFMVLENTSTWLPSTGTRDALTHLFGFDIFAATSEMHGDVPWFSGAALHLHTPTKDAAMAWTMALDWLKEFRQGTTGQLGNRAREPSSDPKRPSISNWPEADKLRHLARTTQSHPPRHNSTLAWPRAGFGLPIIGRFQTTDRNNNRDAYNEPRAFELVWRTGVSEPHDRLASPLIVKALPLADGTFAPCALWLNRAYPVGGEVILRNTSNSQAPFDRLVAGGDTARFAALANKSTLREAFLDWLHVRHHTTVVAP